MKKLRKTSRTIHRIGCRTIYCQMPWNSYDPRVIVAGKVGFTVTNLQVGLNKFRTRYYEAEKPHSLIKIVMIHPWGLFGGSAIDCHLISNRLSQVHSLDTLTYDGRGCGKSSGTATIRSLKEVSDCNTVCHWLSEGFHCPIITVGFGVGACIAGSVMSSHNNVVASIAIGYPLSFPYNYLFKKHHDAFFQSNKPRLMLYGSNDEYTPREAYESYIKSASSGIEKIVYNGPHFSNNLSDGYDRQIANFIARYVSKVEQQYDLAIDLGNPPPRIKLPNRTYGKDFTQEAARRSEQQFSKTANKIPMRTEAERAFANPRVYDLF